MPFLANAFRYLIAEPLKVRSLRLFNFRFAQLLHERANGRLDFLYGVMASGFASKVPLPEPTLLSKESIQHVVESLQKNGWAVLPERLSDADVDELTRFAISTPAYTKSMDDERLVSFSTTSTAPSANSRYVWRMDRLIKNLTVQRLVTESAFHHIAQEYLGARPILTSITLWLDPVFDGCPEEHIYHYDNDGPRFVKFFIYLTDVDFESGAHTYIQRTHGHIKPRPFKLSRRYDRDGLLRYYGKENEIVFSAPRGTVIVEDTAGFHKGTTPKTRHRLLMQFEYSLIDIPHIEELSDKIRRVDIPSLHPAIARISRKFFT